MKRSIAALFALIAFAAAGVPAMAADDPSNPSSWYVGAGAGQSKFRDTCSNAASAGFVGTCDEKDTAWKIFGGYQFNRNFGAELGYTDLGKLNAAGTAGGAAFTASAKVHGFELVGLGSLPIGQQLSVYAKLGIYHWEVSVDATAALPPAFATASASARGTSATYGLGARFDFAKNLAARVEWQRYNSLGDSTNTGKDSADMLSASFIYKF